MENGDEIGKLDSSMAFIEISDFLKLVQFIAKLNRNNICIHVHVAGYIV